MDSINNINVTKQWRALLLTENPVTKVAPKKRKRFYLDSPNGAKHFSRREAQIAYLLKNNRYFDIAVELGLSKRTVEYYIKKMKTKHS